MRHVVLRIEYPSQHWRGVKDIPESCIHYRCIHVGGQLLSHNQGALVEVKVRQTGEAPVSRLNVVEPRTRHQTTGRSPGNPRVVDRDDPLRLWIRQVPKKCRIYYREHRCRRRNPQCHRQHHHQRKSWCASHLPQRVSCVLGQAFQYGQSLLCVVLLPDRLRRAKLYPRLPPRLLLAHTGPQIGFRLARHIVFHLLAQPCIAATASGKIAQTNQESMERPHARSSALTSKNRAIIAAVCSQSRFSDSRSLRPARVSR